MGFEPATVSLRMRCSTPELHRPASWTPQIIAVSPIPCQALFMKELCHVNNVQYRPSLIQLTLLDAIA